MKYVKQFLIILVFSFVGETLHILLPFPIPASIYGLILLLLGLIFKWVPLASVKKAGHFLVEIMPVMFIPAAVGLLDSWDILQPLWLPYLAITVLSTLLVMIISGRVTQTVIRHQAKGGKK